MPGVTAWRVRAALLDLALILAWAVVVAVVVMMFTLTGFVPGLHPLAANLLGGALVLVPVVGGLALTEGGRYEASPGKQWFGLRVRRADGGRIGHARALVRNLLKVGPPAVVGHAAGLAWASSVWPVGTDVWILTAVACLIPLGYLAWALLDKGRTPYDVLAGTVVTTTVRGRRVADDGAPPPSD